MSDHNQKDKQQRIHVKGSDKNKHQRKLYPEVQQNREERAPTKFWGDWPPLLKSALSSQHPCLI